MLSLTFTNSATTAHVHEAEVSVTLEVLENTMEKQADNFLTAITQCYNTDEDSLCDSEEGAVLCESDTDSKRSSGKKKNTTGQQFGDNPSQSGAIFYAGFH